ncbi:MAG: class I SAM-dependent methyltransferase [Opitutaceae bacterium]
MPRVPEDRVAFDVCPLCSGREFRRVPTVDTGPVVRCRACGLCFANPQPSDRELAQIYGNDYVLAPDGSAAGAEIVRSKRATADHYLDLLATHGIDPRGRLLEVGCGAGNFLLQAVARGFHVTGIEYSPFACQRARETLGGRGRVLQGEIDVLKDDSGAYDVCVLCDVIEHVRDPATFLRHVFRLLRPGGAVLVVTPSLDSWSARLMRARWMEFKPEHLFYFDRRTIARQLVGAGFYDLAFHRGTKRLSLDYVAAHFDKYPVPGVTHGLRFLRAISPAALRQKLFPIVASGLVALARKPIGE